MFIVKCLLPTTFIMKRAKLCFMAANGLHHEASNALLHDCLLPLLLLTEKGHRNPSPFQISLFHRNNQADELVQSSMFKVQGMFMPD